MPGPQGPPGPGFQPTAVAGSIIAQPGPVLVPQPDYSDVLDRITRELSTDTMEIANLDGQVYLHPFDPMPCPVPGVCLGVRVCFSEKIFCF